MLQHILISVVVLALSVTGNAAAQTTLYVDQNADQEPHDGSDWCHAYLEVYEALAAAGPNTLILVADGTYLPDPSGLPDPREATFQLANGVTLEGGYAGCGAADPDARDVTLYVTILSGDIGIVGNASDNSYHVTTGSGTDATAILDGFTITAGNSNGSGGGMVNNSGSPIVANCTFSGNSASWSGGGMYNENSSATIVDCTFLENTVNLLGGGGMFNSGGSPTVTGCTFSGNVAGSPYGFIGGGGGMFNDGSSPTVIGCTFSENTAAGFQPDTGIGGGMCNRSGSAPAVVDCTFVGNQGYEGAGMHNSIGSSPQITDCTFIRNMVASEDTAAGMHNEASSPIVTNCAFLGNTRAAGAYPVAGGMFNRDGSDPIVTNCVFVGNWGMSVGGIDNEYSSPTVTNCTFSGNDGGIAGAIFGSATVTNSIFWGDAWLWGEVWGPAVTYSDIEGGHAGTGNINADPLFVQIPDPGPDGEWGTEDDDYGDLRLRPGSPCIDAGDPAFVPAPGDTDLDGHWRVLCGRVDMGAYEFGIGDYDCDQDVDLDDFGSWATCMTGSDGGPYPSGCESFDFEFDGDVDLHDFAGFQHAFTGPQP